MYLSVPSRRVCVLTVQLTRYKNRIRHPGHPNLEWNLNKQLEHEFKNQIAHPDPLQLERNLNEQVEPKH